MSSTSRRTDQWVVVTTGLTRLAGKRVQHVYGPFPSIAAANVLKRSFMTECREEHEHDESTCSFTVSKIITVGMSS